MNRKEKNEQEIIIDWRYLLRALWKRALIIFLAGIIAATAAFVYVEKFEDDQYSSSVMLYVNNQSLSIGSGSLSISASDLAASQSLIDTYIAILMNRTTMEEVAERSNLGYSWGQLMGMVSTSEIEGTEVFQVTVTTTDPFEAALIANCISEVLPERIETIIEGTSMRIVDSAIENPSRVSPKPTSTAIKFFIIGFMAAAAVFVLIIILDDTIRSDDYILETYEVPVLSKIPNLGNESSSPKALTGKHRGYYKRSYSYYGKHADGGKKEDEK